MRAFLLFLLLLAIVALALERRLVVIPDRHHPMAALDVREPPNWLTRYKLRRLAHDPAQCAMTLATAGLEVRDVADRSSERGCGYANAVEVRHGVEAKLAPFVATCPLAVAYALVERNALQPAAVETFGTTVARVDHLGSYACRNVNNAKSGRLSEHARANALDVAGFVLEDGRRVSVARDWNGTGELAVFLRRVHERACRTTNVVLGPEYNAAHRDHFHLDMGGFRACR